MTSLPADRHHARAQRGEVGGELQGHAALGITGEHEHLVAGVGEEVDDGLERRRVDGVERALDVGELGRAVTRDRLVAGELADALGGRTQLVRQVTLDRRLQGAEPLEAQLGRQADDRGRAGARRLGEVGDGAEADELRALQHDGSDTSLGGRELRAGVADPRLHLQLPHRARQ